MTDGASHANDCRKNICGRVSGVNELSRVLTKRRSSLRTACSSAVFPRCRRRRLRINTEAGKVGNCSVKAVR